MFELKSLVYIGPALSGIGTILAVIVAIFAWSVSRKSADVIRTGSIGSTLQWCNVRYVELDDSRDQVPTGEYPPKAALHYFERLWELHYIEYHLYRLKLIPPDVYSLWLWIRNRQYHSAGGEVGRCTQAEGWQHAVEYLQDEGFCDAMAKFITVKKELKDIRGDLKKVSKEWRAA